MLICNLLIELNDSLKNNDSLSHGCYALFTLLFFIIVVFFVKTKEGGLEEDVEINPETQVAEVNEMSQTPTPPILFNNLSIMISFCMFFTIFIENYYVMNVLMYLSLPTNIFVLNLFMLKM